MIQEEGYSSYDDSSSESDDSSDPLSDTIKDYLESGGYVKVTKAKQALSMVFNDFNDGTLFELPAIAKFMDQTPPDAQQTNGELVRAAIDNYFSKTPTIHLEFSSADTESPFSTYRTTDAPIGPARIAINIKHPSIQSSPDEISATAMIEFFQALVDAQLSLSKLRFLNQDQELIYSQLTEFVKTPYFVAVKVHLDEEAWGVIDISNDSSLTKIIFPFVGFERSTQESKGFVGNQTFYFKGEDKINFFRFLLDKIPFTISSKEDYYENILEGITVAAEDDFLPVPRLQLTRNEYDIDNNGQKNIYKIETMYLDLSALNRQNILRAIQEKIADREEIKPFE